MTPPELKHLETQLWKSADDLSANSDLAASEYDTPVLGLIFLKFADGKSKLPIRAALAGYLLRRWNVDCTVDHRLVDSEYHLWLQNPATLRAAENDGLTSLALALGFQGVGDPLEESSGNEP